MAQGIMALEELKGPYFVLWLNHYYFVLLDFFCFCIFFHFSDYFFFEIQESLKD